MTAMRSERHGNERPAPEKLSEVDQAATAFEGEIREFIRRDVAFLRRPPQPETEPGADNVNALIKRVSGNLRRNSQAVRCVNASPLQIT